MLFMKVYPFFSSLISSFLRSLVDRGLFKVVMNFSGESKQLKIEFFLCVSWEKLSLSVKLSIEMFFMVISIFLLCLYRD